MVWFRVRFPGRSGGHERRLAEGFESPPSHWQSAVTPVKGPVPGAGVQAWAYRSALSAQYLLARTADRLSQALIAQLEALEAL